MSGQNGAPDYYDFDSNDNIVGTANAMPRSDYLHGSDGGDDIQSGEGNDLVDAKDGDDTIHAGNGNDVVAGGGGDDFISGENGNDILHGDMRVDGATATTMLDHNWDGIPDDPLSGAISIEQNRIEPAYVPVQYSNVWDIYSLSGPDLEAYLDQDYYNSIHRILYALSPARFDSLLFTDLTFSVDSLGDVSHGGNDVIDGGAGDDFIYGDAGDDTLLGGDGNDYLRGGSGADYLDGGADDDVLFGDSMTYTDYRYSTLDVEWGVFYKTPEVETYESQFGNDVLFGGSGDDYLFGMAGSDVLYGEDGNDVLVGDFIETITVPVERLNLDGTSYIDSSTHCEEAVQYHGNDVLDGGAGDDVLIGLAGDDQLSGGDDNDVLIGDGTPAEVQNRYGNDNLEGGGRKRLVGWQWWR